MGIFDAFTNPYKKTAKAYKVAANDFANTRQTVDPFFQGQIETADIGRQRLSEMLGLTGDYDQTVANFRNAPGYQFMFDEGLRGLDQSAAARGSLNSGAHQKALMGYGQGMADQSWQQQINNLAGLQSGGFAAANGLTNNSQTWGNLRIGQGQASDMNRQGGLANMLGAIGTVGSLVSGYGGGGLGGGLSSMFSSAPKMPTYSNGAVNPWAVY